MVDALQQLRERISALEAEPRMQKGLLMQRILGDTSIKWDTIFATLRLRGRHRNKLRWRRAVIQDAIRRPFLRGGPRRGRRTVNI